MLYTDKYNILSYIYISDKVVSLCTVKAYREWRDSCLIFTQDGGECASATEYRQLWRKKVKCCWC